MDDQTQDAPKRGRKPKITVAPRTVDQLDVDSIIAKRLQGDPRYTPTPAVPLRDPQKWYVKEANSYGDPNRHYQMVHAEGYIPFTIDHLPENVTPASIGWSVAEDGVTLCRGERGAERLYLMTKEHRRLIEQKKTEMNLKGTGSERAVREHTANAVASQFDAQAADFVHQHMVVTGADTRETR